MGRYRKKPVVIEAIQWTGDNYEAVEAFAGYTRTMVPLDSVLGLFTLEGFKPCPIGYWIVKGVKGEFYPVDPEIFAMTYEEVE